MSQTLGNILMRVGGQGWGVGSIGGEDCEQNYEHHLRDGSQNTSRFMWMSRLMMCDGGAAADH